MSVSSAGTEMQIERAGPGGGSTQTDQGIPHTRLNDADESSIQEKKSKKPKDSAFKQQRLPAWQPILTAGTVLPTFFIIGFAFIPIGIGMLWFSDHVNEIKLEYHNCKSVDDTSKTCDEIITAVNSSTAECQCEVEFKLDEDWEKDVYLYYGLTNFYQNHRRYVKSRDDAQLLGNVDKTPSSECEPFDIDPTTGKKYFPCGAIANSLFSDEIKLFYEAKMVGLINKGIAWESDKKYKFKNPDKKGGTLQDALNGTVKPRDWPVNLWQLDPLDESNNGLENEDLIVWMRTAALPNFRKLYRKINHTEEFTDGLPKGNYRFEIKYRYRVNQFNGKKSLILSTTSILGGKNPFLGIAYITVGSICMLMGVVFLFIHVKCGKQTSEMMNINSRSTYT